MAKPKRLILLHPVSHTKMAPDSDLAGLRVAASEDFGSAPTARDVRATFGVKIALFAISLRDATSRRLIAAAPMSPLPCCARSACSPSTARGSGIIPRCAVRTYAPASRMEGQRYSAVDVARAMAVQTAIHQRWQTFFANYDVILSPAITISPRPRTELYPKEIDGDPTGSYFHWLALAYAVTVVGHPALSLPGGLDHAGMPFGLQIVGPRGADAKVLAVAAALNWQAMPEPAGRARTLRRSVGRPP